MNGHVWYVCPGIHADGGWSCMFCAGDLKSCVRCGEAEGGLAPTCPGERACPGEDSTPCDRPVLGGKWCEKHTRSRSQLPEGNDPSTRPAATDNRHEGHL